MPSNTNEVGQIAPAPETTEIPHWKSWDGQEGSQR